VAAALPTDPFIVIRNGFTMVGGGGGGNGFTRVVGRSDGSDDVCGRGRGGLEGALRNEELFVSGGGAPASVITGLVVIMGGLGIQLDTLDLCGIGVCNVYPFLL